MTATAPATGATELRQIPLGELHESPLNPRKHFDPGALEQLAASLRATGQMTPIVVRPRASGPGYEIGAGARRFRAAKLAGLPTLEARIRAMDDPTFIELLNIENLQRDDLHALEEAEGFRTLMERAGYDVKKIAVRIGKSERYVYDSLTLLRLTPRAKKLFLADRFQRGHAVLLARLSPPDQERAIGDPKAFDDYTQDEGGLFQDEHVGDTIGKDGEVQFAGDGDEPTLKARSVRELEAWIRENVRAKPQQVDGFLFPEPKAALQDAAAQKLKVIPITYDYRVPDGARDEKERTYGEKAWKRADGRFKSKPCEHSGMGFVVAGPGQGEAFLVCVKKDKCKVHWAKEQSERAREQKAAKSAGAKDGESYWQKQQRLDAARAERERAEQERWKRAAPKLLELLAERIKTAPTKPGSEIADTVLSACRDGRRVDVGAALPRARTADDLLRHGAYLSLAGEINQTHTWGAASRWPKLLKPFGINALKVLDEVAPPPKKEAYRRAALRLHPDIVGGTLEAFQELQTAKAVLEAHHA